MRQLQTDKRVYYTLQIHKRLFFQCSLITMRGVLDSSMELMKLYSKNDGLRLLPFSTDDRPLILKFSVNSSAGSAKIIAIKCEVLSKISF